MRYYYDDTAVFVNGAFRAASTGISGGIRSVPALLALTAPGGDGLREPGKELELAAARSGIGAGFLGLLTRVPVRHVCVFQYDFITVFIAADVPRGPEQSEGAVSLIVCSGEGMSDAALLGTILVTAEAKAEALLGTGCGVSGMPRDAIIAACEGDVKHSAAGRLTEAGLRIRETVLYGVPAAIRLCEDPVQKDRPAFFIFSRIGGGHWVEWSPENCPYFPCHFAGQDCDFCYCPFYPCGNESLGRWAESPAKGKVWNCADCTLLHEPETADYLKKHPGASLSELVRRRKSPEKKK
ncbi:MAG TPA: cysteine-rich small domain-containing protein [Methanoregula sp.]|nr:cysteine-rich small domain-containing protein [Methanoregula sp.]